TFLKYEEKRTPRKHKITITLKQKQEGRCHQASNSQYRKILSQKNDRGADRN
ncbi:hypothetical protein HispidOSU_021968, partial [Sigmodon hispidus]